LFVAYRSDNFVVGLTYNNPRNRAPVRGKYTLCGQYPGAVPAGATVTVHCTNVYNTRLRYRYVIVQFPLIDDLMNVCEIEVFTLGRCATTLCLRKKQEKLKFIFVITTSNFHRIWQFLAQWWKTV